MPYIPVQDTCTDSVTTQKYIGNNALGTQWFHENMKIHTSEMIHPEPNSHWKLNQMIMNRHTKIKMTQCIQWFHVQHYNLFKTHADTFTLSKCSWSSKWDCYLGNSSCSTSRQSWRGTPACSQSLSSARWTMWLMTVDRWSKSITRQAPVQDMCTTL